MKAEIQVHSVESETTLVITRHIRNGKVTYRNNQYIVYENMGQYVIDASRPIRSGIEQYRDDVVLQRAQEILTIRGKTQDSWFIESPDAIKKIFMARHLGLPAEQFDIAFLTNRHCLIEIRTMFYGTIDSASVHPREILRAVMETNAAAIVLAHNHPSGVAEPSRADLDITKKIQQILKMIDTRVLDHVITGGSYAVSLAERGEF